MTRPSQTSAQEPHFLIYTAGYNCADYVERCLRSVESQTYKNYTQIIVDDASTDDTWSNIQRFEGTQSIARRNDQNLKWTQTALRHLHPADEDVVAVLDLDDFFACDTALETLRNIYVRNQCWLTYGNYCDCRQLPSTRLARLIRRCLGPLGKPKGLCRQLPAHILAERAFRQMDFTTSHVRTFKGFLWNAIRPEDLLDWTGHYPPMAGDAATMFPMLDMCAPSKIGFVPDVLYAYNTANPLNEHKINFQLQRQLERWFRQKPPYSPLNGH